MGEACAAHPVPVLCIYTEGSSLHGCSTKKTALRGLKKNQTNLKRQAGRSHIFPKYPVLNSGRLEEGQTATTMEESLGNFHWSVQKSFSKLLSPACSRREKTLVGRGEAAAATPSFSCCQIKRTDSPFSAHSGHTMGEGDQRQNYKCEPLMHQVEQWALEASVLSREAVQLVLAIQCHGKKAHCPGEKLPRMKTPSSDSFLQLPNGKQNNKPGPQLNKHATN